MTKDEKLGVISFVDIHTKVVNDRLVDWKIWKGITYHDQGNMFAVIWGGFNTKTLIYVISALEENYMIKKEIFNNLSLIHDKKIPQIEE